MMDGMLFFKWFTKTWLVSPLVIWDSFDWSNTVLQTYSMSKNWLPTPKAWTWTWPGLSFFLSANLYSRTSIQVFDPMEAPAMPSRKSEIVARLRIVACEKLCLSCYFPALTSFLDEKLGHLERSKQILPASEAQRWTHTWGSCRW